MILLVLQTPVWVGYRVKVARFLQVLWSLGKLVLKYRSLDLCWVLFKCRFVHVEAVLLVCMDACVCALAHVCVFVYQRAYSRFQCLWGLEPGIMLPTFITVLFYNSMRWALGLQPVEGYKAASTLSFIRSTEVNIHIHVRTTSCISLVDRCLWMYILLRLLMSAQLVCPLGSLT